MGEIGRIAKKTPINIKYNILKNYIDGNGGTLRIAKDGRTIQYQPQSVKNAATQNSYAGVGGSVAGTT